VRLGPDLAAAGCAVASESGLGARDKVLVAGKLGLCAPERTAIQTLGLCRAGENDQRRERKKSFVVHGQASVATRISEPSFCHRSWAGIRQSALFGSFQLVADFGNRLAKQVR
jgi:hypothetical protein